MHGQQTPGAKGPQWWPGRCSAFPALLIKAGFASLRVRAPKMVLFAWKAKRTFEQRGRSVEERSCMGPEGLMMGLINHPELLTGDRYPKKCSAGSCGQCWDAGKGTEGSENHFSLREIPFFKLRGCPGPSYFVGAAGVISG